jgi:tetratricopeptide (TPR) repeat protein
MKAGLLDKKGMSAEAIETFEKVYQLVPYDVELNYALAFKYADTKNAKVIGLCDSLIKADSLGVHHEPYYYKGIYYSNIGDNTKALQMFDRTIKLNYYFLEGYIEKATTLYDMKDYREALKVLNLVVTISPKFADGYYWAGKCQEALGEKDAARLNYQKAYGLDNSDKDAKEAINRLSK